MEQIRFRQGASLTELQEYVTAVCTARGWAESQPLETFLLFTEEVGELAKAIRKRMKLWVEEGKTQEDDLEGELADLLSYLLEIANRFGVNLEQAYREKEEKNWQRSWDYSKDA